MNDNVLDKSRAWIEINVNNLIHNVNEIRRLLKNGQDIIAVVKADAYGHGVVKVAKALNDAGVYFFAVATLSEAIELRKSKVKGKVLILGYTDVSCAHLISKYDLIQTIVDFDYALKLNDALKCKVNVHVKINTGMNRIGISYDALDDVVNVFKLKNLRVTGFYTHLCCSDSLKKDDVSYTKKQVKRFNDCVCLVKNKGLDPGVLHVQSSYGIINYDDLSYDYVRPGIIMYGVDEKPFMRLKNHFNLKPVLTLKAKVGSVFSVKKGSYVGYARCYQAKKDMKIATLCIGYADGYPRSLSNKKAVVLMGGKPCKVVGNVCMDQLMVDVSSLDNVKQGDVAVLIGDEKEIKAERLAFLAGTISHELLSGLGKRLKRIIK